MTPTEAVERIHQCAWMGQNPGLTRIGQLLEALGSPQEQLKFVHIAGTNGKGSTAAMTASILTQAGLRTGLYTSPHLWRFHERFQIDGVPMGDEALVEIAGLVLETAGRLPIRPTEFELMTAMGMVYFAREGCDIVVLEVGLGGRLDSTNIISPPEVAVITNIGLEHTQLLGDTVGKIAGEKAGIIKPGSEVVLYHQDREAETVVEAACRRAGNSLTVTDPHELEVLSTGLKGSEFRYRGEGPYRLALLGEYQLRNALTALETVHALQKRGWAIPVQAVNGGLALARWPGRMELVRRHPDVMVDGGHNPQCMAALTRSLRELYPGKKLIFVTGMLADKDFHAMLGDLLPLAKRVIAVTPDSPRALSGEELARLAREAGVEATVCPSISAGTDAALAMAGAEDGICVCGSLYLVGEVRHHLGLC